MENSPLISTGFANERRRSVRLQAVPNQVDLQWSESSQSRVSHGNIVNVSPHGALLSAVSSPDVGNTVHIRTSRPVRSDWIQAVVVRKSTGGQSGIDFNGSCPYDLVLAAAVGIDILSSFSLISESDRFSRTGD